MTGDLPSVDAAIDADLALIDCGFFQASLSFQLETVVHTREAAFTIMGAIRNRTGLEDCVDMTSVLYAEP